MAKLNEPPYGHHGDELNPADGRAPEASPPAVPPVAAAGPSEVLPGDGELETPEEAAARAAGRGVPPRAGSHAAGMTPKGPGVLVQTGDDGHVLPTEIGR